LIVIKGNAAIDFGIGDDVPVIRVSASESYGPIKEVDALGEGADGGLKDIVIVGVIYGRLNAEIGGPLRDITDCGHRVWSIAPGGISESEPAKSTDAPGPYSSGAVNGQGMPISGGDGDDVFEITLSIEADDPYGGGTSVVCAVAELAVGVITPGPKAAVYVESEAMAVAGRDGDNIFKVRVWVIGVLLSGFDYYGDIADGGSAVAEAPARAIVTTVSRCTISTPGVDCAITIRVAGVDFFEGHRVVPAGGDCEDVLERLCVAWVLPAGKDFYRGRADTPCSADAQFAESVIAPGIDAAVAIGVIRVDFFEGHRMRCPGRDGNDVFEVVGRPILLTFEDLDGGRRMGILSLLISELAFVVSSPGPDEAVYVKGEGVVPAGVYVVDILKVVDVVRAVNSHECVLVGIVAYAELVMEVPAATPDGPVCRKNKCVVFAARDLYGPGVIGDSGAGSCA